MSTELERPPRDRHKAISSFAAVVPLMAATLYFIAYTSEARFRAAFGLSEVGSYDATLMVANGAFGLWRIFVTALIVALTIAAAECWFAFVTIPLVKRFGLSVIKDTPIEEKALLTLTEAEGVRFSLLWWAVVSVVSLTAATAYVGPRLGANKIADINTQLLRGANCYDYSLKSGEVVSGIAILATSTRVAIAVAPKTAMLVDVEEIARVAPSKKAGPSAKSSKPNSVSGAPQ